MAARVSSGYSQMAMHQSSALPWDALFHTYEVDPYYSTDNTEAEYKKHQTVSIYSHSVLPWVFVQKNLDRKRMKHFILKFQERLQEFAKTERAKYPGSLKLKKQYKGFSADELPVIYCACSSIGLPSQSLKYVNLRDSKQTDWSEPEDRDDSGRYIQHLMQVEDSENLLRIPYIDPECYRADSHGHWGNAYCPSGYGYRTKYFYLKLYLLINFSVYMQERLRTPINFFYFARDPCRAMSSHIVYLKLKADPYLQGENAKQELIRLIFKQLYLYEMLNMEVGKNSEWETAIQAHMLQYCRKCKVEHFLNDHKPCPQ